jgi:transposase
MRAVKLRRQGHSRTAIGEMLEAHRHTIGRWVADHKIGGVKALQLKRRGRKKGEMRRWSAQQEKTVQAMLCEKTPDQLKLAFALWTRRAVCELVERAYGIGLPVRTCGESLAHWGFTPQKPARRAAEQNPPAVAAWMAQTYPAIARRAKTEGAEIHWGDETGGRRDCPHGGSEAPRGRTPVVRLRARRFSSNMISTVTNQGQVRGMIYRETLSSAVCIKFLERLIKDAAGKVFLIVDNLKGPHSAPVKAWLLEHAAQIEVFHLPSDRPERNPDEYLNGDLKTALTSTTPAHHLEALENKVIRHMRKRQRSPQHVASYFRNQYVQYAASLLHGFYSPE